MGVSFEKLKERAEGLKESNPMLGHRGCRLGISHPEITEMQARAIFEAACEVAREGVKVIPEVMIPLVGHVNELKAQREIVDRVAKEVFAQTGMKIKYLVGTMIELPGRRSPPTRSPGWPSSSLTGRTTSPRPFSASPGTTPANSSPSTGNPGSSNSDPFVSIDRPGVGEVIRIGVEKGRGANPELEVGICGEHGGDPSSVEFCHLIGLDYVSCSPYRVPIARLAAARAAITYPRKKKLTKRKR